MTRTHRRAAGIGAMVAVALTIAACGSSNPLKTSTAHASAGTITIGSANFVENEILAYVYADALKANGIKVTVKPNIGARAAYIAALKQGAIDLVPEYSGNLLQYFRPNTTATSSAAVFAALPGALPSGMEVLKQASAQDADSYNVTQAFSTKYHLTSLAQLKSVDTKLKVAADPEFATRPYGIPGLKKFYGVSATLVPIDDGGGPNTLKALTSGEVQLADIYSTTPSIKQNHLVTLADPQHMILAQNIVPLISTAKASAKVTTVLDKVQASLTTTDLLSMNTRSLDTKDSAQSIAAWWLAQKHLF